MAHGYQKIIGSGVKVLAIITGGQYYTYNHESQFEDMFPEVDFKELLTTQFLPKAEHIITEPDYQLRVLEEVASWMPR